MSGKDKRSPPDTGGGSHLENSIKGATSSRRRMLPNVGRSSDVEETDRKFDEAACSDNHQTASSRADSTDSNLKGKKKGAFVSDKPKTFSSEQTTETQHQLKQKTHLCEKGEKKKILPGQDKNEPKVCLPYLAEEWSKENLKIHGNKNVEGFSTCASAGHFMKGENLSKSFVVVTSDDKDEIELKVKMEKQDCFSVSVGLNDTVEAVMLKIEEKTGIFCENQRLVKAGTVLLKSETLQSYGIGKDSTIHLVVKTENAADKATVDISSGLESNPRIQNAPSPTPTSDVCSKYLHKQQGSGILTHPKDFQMKEKIEKSQQLIPDSKSPPKSAFMKSYKEITTKVEKLTTKVSDVGSDMNQEKADTEIEIEGEMKIPQNPETDGEKKTPQTPDTEGEKDTKDDLNDIKMDKGLQVIVVALDKKKIAIDVKPDETVAAVKEKLMDKIACETEDFCLNLDGERLDDKHTVKSYKIHPNSEIIMMRQRRKGGNKEKMHPLSSTDEHGIGADQVIDDKENEDIGGARGNSSPIFNSSSRPDETGEYVRLKDTSHVNENATHDYVNIAGQDDTVGSNEQMAKQNSLTTSKSKTKFGHSLTLKETQRSSKTVSCGNEDGKFNDDSHSLTLNPSTVICQLKKSRSTVVPASEDMLIPKKGHGLHKASVQTVEQSSSKMVKEKSMVNPCGKDLGDSSQSDGESNPHSNTEDPDVDELTVSFNTQLNLNDSDADTAGSLPQTDDQQIAGQHGASGQADSGPFVVRFKYNADEQGREVLNFEKYMKYHYVLNHKECFTNVASDLKKENKIDISVKGGILHIYQGQKYGRRYIKTVMDFILRHTGNIVINGWPCSGVDIEKAEQELLSSELGKLKEIYVRRYKDEMHVACDFSLSKKVEQDVSKAFKKFLFANKGNISKTCDVPYILHGILKNTDWKKQFEDKYPNVQVEWEPDDDEDVVKVVFSGNKEKVLEAMKWFEDNIVGEYCHCSKEMVKIPELSFFSQPEEVVLEYLRMKYENQTDIVFDINRKKATVWLCSISSQAKADVAMNELTNKGEIVKTVEIHVDKTMLHDTGINELIPDWNKSKYAVVQVDEDKIVVKGLEKYVCEFEGKITEMLKRKQNMPKSGKFLEYDSFLLYIETNGVLRSLSERYKIQYSAFKNEERNGIFFIGEETCLTEFNEELEKKMKEYITHNIDIHLGKGMESTKLDEILHTAEKDHDGHVKIEKVKYKDTTPGNYKTATVLGPTLKDDLQDCLYSQWCLDAYTVTVVETRSDFQSADVVLVPVDDWSKSDFSQGSVKEITVPIPESQMYKKNPIDIIEKTISNTLSDEACVSVRIKSSAINGCRSRYRYAKPILYSLKKWAEKSKGPRKDIVFCCCDKDAFDCCFKYCHDAFGTKYVSVKPINKDLYMDDFVVNVREGGIVDFAVDVIVNTTSDDLKLNSGAVSSTILKNAGPELQKDVNKKRPNGINYGEILETEAFKLENAEVILHGALEEYNNDAKKLQKLEEFVHSCLVHADSRQYSSIALPAIGTGKLGYNKSQVAATMFKAAKKFFRDHHPSALRCVMFVIYGKDRECLKAFEKEEKLWNQYLIWQSRAVVYEGVRVQPNQGSILDTTTDAVIYFWDDGIIHGSVTTRSNTVLAACGRNVFDTVSKKMRSKEANLILQKAENIKVDIFFMRTQNSPEEISKATRECLLKADKCKNITSICIAFDKSHSFLLNKELTHYLCEAIKDVSHELHQIKQVEIMVEDENSFTKVLGYFKLEKTGLLKMKEPLRIEVSGFKEHVAKAVAEIKDKFSQLQTGNDIAEAEPKNDKKDTDIKELLQKDDRVQLDSSSHSSESSVETIPCEELDEQIREWENSSTSSLSMSSITHIPDDKEKDFNLDTVSEGIGVFPLQGTDCVSGRKVDNAAYIPETQIARGEEGNQVFRIKKVGNSYVLKHNNLKVKIPQLDGASGVSVDEDIILIDNEPIYDIEINNGKVKISKIGDAECEVNRSDNNSTNNSGNKETGLYVGSQQPQNVEEESDMKKVRGTSQDMQDVLNSPKENRPNPLNHQDTVADVKHTGSFDADVLKQGGKTAFDAPGEQQPSLEEAVYKDEKLLIPAPRSKRKDAKKLENVQKSEFIFKGYDGKKCNTKVSWNFPKAKDLKKEDKDELKKIHVNVDEATGKIETLTTYQFKCAKAILAKYDKQKVIETEEGINENELVTIANRIEMEATEDVWNIVSEICKKDIISFEKKCGPVKFENSKIVIPAHDSDVAKNVQKLKTSIQETMKKEIAEILIDSKKLKKPDVPGFCKEVDESFGYECCVWNPDKNKVYAYDDTFEKVLMVKHKFSITSGLTKPTGQNRRKNRGAAHIQSNDDTASDELKSDNRFELSLKKTSVEHSSKKTSVYQSDKEQCYKFGNTLVKVYKGDILNLNVDCIVNAANKSLSHGGGVAQVIARAAGYSLTKEGDDYIAQYGEIPVGHAIATTAGDLHYKCVIHTVLPRWFDYKSRSHDDVQRCRDDLYHAIFNCFTIAERRELRSIAIPAISSAIFGVPMEICVEQYARATLSYCKNAAEATALSEIHFIDIKPKTVKKIQEAFEAKQREGASVEITRGADSEGFGATSLKTREENTGELPEPLAYEEGWKQNVFCFIDSEKLNVYCKDIFSVKANGIVVSVNEKGKWGAIGQTIFNKIPKSYLRIFNDDFERKINQGTKTGDVIVNNGYSCGYQAVLLVIYPYEARHKPQDKRQADLERAYKNVLLAARDKQIHTVVTTLFGIESDNDDDVKFASNCFLKSYLEHCKQKVIEMDSFQKEVTIVCQTEHAHSLVCEVFMKYVQDQKDI